MTSMNGALMTAVLALDEAERHARETRWQLCLVKNGVVAPLKKRDDALATLNTIRDARKMLSRLLDKKP